MIRSVFRALRGTALAFVLLSFMTAAALAETINFPGASLQTIWGVPTLAPSGSDSGKSASLSGNRVTLNSDTVAFVIGGVNENDSAAVTNNHVIINNGTVTGHVYGGYAVNSSAASVTSNIMTISGGTVGMNVFGGYASSSTNATIDGNRVYISGGEVGDVTGGWGSGSGATATGNIVTISDGEVGHVYGGYATGGGNTATDNTVIISGGTSTIINGGLFGGFTSDGIYGPALESRKSCLGFLWFGCRHIFGVSLTGSALMVIRAFGPHQLVDIVCLTSEQVLRKPVRPFSHRLFLGNLG